MDRRAQAFRLELDSRNEQGKPGHTAVQLLDRRAAAASFGMYEPKRFTLDLQPVISAIDQTGKPHATLDVRKRAAAHHADQDSLLFGELLEHRSRLRCHASQLGPDDDGGERSIKIQVKDQARGRGNPRLDRASMFV